MQITTRRKFLQTSVILTASAMVGSSFSFQKQKPLLSFSTLGCPDWPFDKIVSFARQNNYDGIELRGILHEMDLTKCLQFINATSIASTMQLMKDNNLKFVDLGSSCMLHFPEGEERNKNLDEAKRFIDLAAKIDCPYVRVFPNEFPKNQSKETTIDLIIKGLGILGDYAKESNVTVLVETHGAMVYVADVLAVMKTAASTHIGLVWDVTNMWTVTGEPVTEVYKTLKPYIHHTHIKDAVKINGEVHYKLLGEGEVPIFAAIDALRAGGYKGYYSFEWEKLWHPEIGDPEIALADYPKKMKKHFEVN
ncbi:MAG TPA: sugar phosphate isomerase/epimerase family protein [Chitinophagaceae bacterium]|nr:sugar phosphate isomerase/epimerase family protein [Chitinophagaceae bacterium]